MRANIIEIAPGARGDIERHGAGTHLFPLGGRGYSLVWNEGQGDVERRDWRFGMAFAPRDGWFHQHFNPGDEAARLLAISFGNRQTPIFARKVEREFARDRGRHEAGEVGGRIEAIWRSETRA
jgi:hypothetical protein